MYQWCSTAIRSGVSMCFFWSKICNSKLFSSLSDSENSKWAIRYVCAIKNALVRRTIVKVSLAYCNDPKNPFNYQFGVMKVFQNFFSALANTNCWFAKSFFLHSFRVHFAILRENRENEEFLRFPQLKTDCDVIRRRGALFWKAWDLTNKFIPIMLLMDALNGSYGHFFTKKFL